MALNSPATDVSQYLADNGHGQLGVDIFRFEWGTSVVDGEDLDRQILVRNGEGPTQEIRSLVEEPMIQILVRGGKGKSSAAVYATARAVYEFLILTNKVTINEMQYVDFEPLSSPQEIGRDSEDRQTVTMRFLTLRNPTA